MVRTSGTSRARRYHRPGAVLRGDHRRARAPGASSKPCSGPPPMGRATARRRSARCCWPRPSSNGCRASSSCGSCRAAPRPRCPPIRVARGFTGRADGREVRRQLPRPRRPAPRRGRQRRSPRSDCPGSDGVTEGRGARHACRARTTSCPSSTITACVIVEPIAANMGLVAPVAGLPQGLRDECDRVGALLDLRRGHHRLPRRPRTARRACFGVRPDLTSLRQGHRRRPAGRRLRRAPRRHVVRRPARAACTRPGTLSGNPLAMAAGLAALELLDDAAYTTLGQRSRRGSATAWPRHLRRRRESQARVPVEKHARRALLRPDQRRPTTRRREGHRRGRRTRGSSTRSSTRAWPSPPGAYEIMFPGLAHDGAVLDEIVAAAAGAAAHDGL